MPARTACLIITCDDDDSLVPCAVDIKLVVTPKPAPGERSVVALIGSTLIDIVCAHQMEAKKELAESLAFREQIQ
jgi:hypothetical protein